MLGADAGCAYTDEEIMEMYIDQVYGEECYGVLFDQHCDENYIVYEVKDSDGDGMWHCTNSRNYMIQRIERGY